MAQTNSNQADKDLSIFQIAEVIREGRHIVLPAIPEPMATRDASKLLARLADQEDEKVALSATFSTTPYAGALALRNVLERLYGFVLNKPTMGFFGPNPPASVTVEVDYGKFEEVTWGAFDIPGTTIVLETDVTAKNNIAIFALNGSCSKADKPKAQQLFEAVRDEVANRSIYVGKAVKLKQKGPRLDLSGPDACTFMDLDHDLRNRLILNTHTHDAVEVELLTPIEHREFAKRAWGISLNRVALLSGPYGTGKSMTGAVIAAVTAANGGTFILLENVTALPQALAFISVMKLQNAVVFAEDIDRVIGGGRDSGKDTLLNLISGVQSATSEVMVVLTTNEIEAIHPAMIRRFQAVIEYTNPDEATVRQLLYMYGSWTIQGELVEAPKMLAGIMPSLIKDVVNSAKLAAVRGERTYITDEDLVWAARQIETRRRLATREVKPEPLSVALAEVGKGLQNGQSELLGDVSAMVSAIHSHLDI